MIDHRGHLLLNDPLRTKGTAFTDQERSDLKLLGLLPTAVKTIAEQTEHCWHEFISQPTDLGKHIYLRGLQDRNEVLFYRLMREHITDVLPIVYTPTVGEACQRFSDIYRRPRGLFISYPHRDRIADMLANRVHRDVAVIVVTDGQRILGLGDQGIGGMGIPVGKLSLYTLIGGIPPDRTLPIILDVGTDNADLLADPRYLGWRHRRVSTDDYYEFIDMFVAAVRRELPNVLLQWEDFATAHAQPILDLYRDQLLTFNDDIQGTAAVTLGALHGATHVVGKRLRDLQVVMLGAGSAGLGVVDMIHREMVAQGLSNDIARQQIWVLDSTGLITDDRPDLSESKRRFAQSAARLKDWGLHRPATLADIVGRVDIDVMLGLSSTAGAFTEAIVREMASKVDRPIIFPLSNPTSHAEAHPSELNHWTRGRALIATGSPFEPLERDGAKYPVAQCNNVYIFPAIGLATVAAEAWRVTDAMILAAATCLGIESPALRDPNASLLPALPDVPDAADRIALAVALQAVDDGVAPPRTREELVLRIAAARWTVDYPAVAERGGLAPR